VINRVNEISGTIATAVEEQSATTNEMRRNVGEAAKGSGEITSNIAGVAEAAPGASNSAQESQIAADDLAQMAALLRSLVEQFKISGPHTAIVNQSSGSPRPKWMAAHAQGGSARYFHCVPFLAEIGEFPRDRGSKSFRISTFRGGSGDLT